MNKVMGIGIKYFVLFSLALVWRLNSQGQKFTTPVFPDTQNEVWK